MKRVSITEAVNILKADTTYRKDVYLVQNVITKENYCTTGKLGNYSVCRVDRAQCNPETLKANGFKIAFI